MTGPNRHQISAPPFSPLHIQRTAETLTDRFLREFWASDFHPGVFGISFDVVYEHLIYPEFGIHLEEDCDLGFDEKGEKIFGSYDPISNTASIDRILNGDPRREFTVWHEVGGHGVLQGEWLRKQIAKIPRNGIVSTELSLSPRVENLVERQANMFAACAGIPRRVLCGVLENVFDLEKPLVYRGRGKYTFVVNGHTQTRNILDFANYAWTIGSFISYRFGRMSAESIGYRLQQCRYVKDETASRFDLRRTSKSRRLQGVA